MVSFFSCIRSLLSRSRRPKSAGSTTSPAVSMGAHLLQRVMIAATLNMTIVSSVYLVASVAEDTAEIESLTSGVAGNVTGTGTGTGTANLVPRAEPICIVLQLLLADSIMVGC